MHFSGKIRQIVGWHPPLYCWRTPLWEMLDLPLTIEWIHRQQVSSPAWTQEAYRPPLIKYSMCCPVPGGTPGTPSSWPGRGSTPGWVPPGWGTPHPDLAQGRGVPQGGCPLAGVFPSCLDLAGVPPELDLTGILPWPGGVPPSRLDLAGILPLTDRWMDGQTRVKTLLSRRTTYAVGNNLGKLHWWK